MSLKNLIALQTQKKSVESNATGVAAPAAPVTEAESPVKEPATVSPPAAAEKPKGLGLNVVKKKEFVVPPLNLASISDAMPAEPAKPAMAIESDGFSLDDLAKLDASSVVTESSEPVGSGFDDEIEATAPDRDLPADVTTEQLSFVESLDGIYQVLHDPEMFGQLVRIIMMELQEYPEYERLMSDSDIHVMIAGMRRTMGLARVRKQEKSRKGKTQTNARAKSGVSDEAMDILNKLMGGGDS